MQYGELNIPAQPHSHSLLVKLWGAESEPKKNFSFPDKAAFKTANLCFSFFRIGKQ